MSPTQSARPRIFIGSSSEGKTLAEELQALLDPHAQPTVWTQDIFTLGEGTLGSLLAAAGSFSFAAFLLTADDTVVKRGARYSTARDNLFFEAGMFLGALGHDRVFLLVPDGANLELPSDLAGVNVAMWRQRDDGNIRAALSPAALDIRKAIRAAGPLDAPTTAATSGDILRFARGGLEDLRTGAAGLGVRVLDAAGLAKWTSNLLTTLLVLFEDREAPDIYAAWLRPEEDPRQLQVAASRNLPADYLHHPFHLGEGLAGHVWETSRPAATSELRRHPWWEPREGCENQAYLCVAVGAPGGSGGVLAVGSDEGFDVRDSDLLTLELFAGLLALAIVEQTSAEQMLCARVETLANGLATRRGDEVVESTTVQVYNSHLALARSLCSEDGLLAKLPKAPARSTRVSGLRVLLEQLVIALKA
jgi:GAF domain-containing protein